MLRTRRRWLRLRRAAAALLLSLAVGCDASFSLPSSEERERPERGSFDFLPGVIVDPTRTAVYLMSPEEAPTGSIWLRAG